MSNYNKDIKLKLDYTDPSANGNIAKKLSKEQRAGLGEYIKTHVEADQQSRTTWLKQNTEGLKLAAQIAEKKTYPWPNASNVKFPLVTVAAIQFNSRALPAVVNSGQPVKAAYNGIDKDGDKQNKAHRVAAHMSWQCMEEDENWLEDTDRLMLALPITGQMHRKRYYSSRLGRPASRIIAPQSMIINFNATNLNDCRRTEILQLTHNEVAELERSDLIMKITGKPVDADIKELDDKEELTKEQRTVMEDDTPYTIYEVHWNLDLDGDGYREPYVCLVHENDGQLLSIVPRWEAAGVKTNDKNQVVRIDPLSYYIDYMFIPNPMSSTHGMGFGHLLGPINESVNTLINQLIDAGHLSSIQGGFVGRGVNMKGGTMRITPGKFISVNATGAALKDNIVPFPIKEPSSTLFSLLGMLIQAGKEISSVTEMMQGENPGQNTAATTANAMVEQGMKVFTGIFGRIHRQLSKEHKALFEINRKYHDVEQRAVLLDGEPVQVLKDDYNTESLDIKVASDPNLITDLQQIQKEQGLMELSGMGVVNPKFIAEQRLKRLGYNKEEREEALNVPPPPPNPKMVAIELDNKKFEHQMKMDLLEMQIQEEYKGSEAMKDYADAQKKFAEIKVMEGDQQLKALELFMKDKLERGQAASKSVLEMIQAAKADAEIKFMGKESKADENKPGGKAATAAK